MVDEFQSIQVQHWQYAEDQDGAGRFGQDRERMGREGVFYGAEPETRRSENPRGA
jgi:hypothetical protein